MRYLIIFLCLFCNLQMLSAGGEFDVETSQFQAFYESLQAEIDRTERFVMNLIDEINNQTIFSQIKRAELEVAISTLEVKKTLMQNFYETPSLQIKEIRDMLLEIFQKDLIQEIDLLELQEMVNRYRA